MKEDKKLFKGNSQDSPVVSVVLACYNERDVLEESVYKIRDVLDNSKYSYELIFVDDSSSDGTPEIIRKLTANRQNEKVLLHSRNQGRGKTVADGIKAARGEIAGFIDVDLETEAFYIPALTLEIEKGADIATARRIYKLQIPSLPRQILSIGYINLVRSLLNVQLKDTETGCKFFNREKISPVLDEIRDTHWFWDTEIMVRSYLKGYRIKEIPTLYIRKHDTGTTVKIFRDTLIYFKNLLAFYWELRADKREKRL